MENTETTQCSLAKLRLNNNSNFVFGRILTVMGDPSHLPGFTDLLNNPHISTTGIEKNSPNFENHPPHQCNVNIKYSLNTLMCIFYKDPPLPSEDTETRPFSWF